MVSIVTAVTIIITTLLGIFCVFKGLPTLFVMLIDKLFGTNYTCSFFGWHDGRGNVKKFDFDGCSAHSTCNKCGKKIMQDSQGNWF